jgi:hypothetical protein
MHTSHGGNVTSCCATEISQGSPPVHQVLKYCQQSQNTLIMQFICCCVLSGQRCMCQLRCLSAMLSMLALSSQQCPALMSASAVHVLQGPSLGSLKALCMLSAFPTCVLTGCLLTPEGKAKKQRISLVTLEGHGLWVPGLLLGIAGPLLEGSHCNKVSVSCGVDLPVSNTLHIDNTHLFTYPGLCKPCMQMPLSSVRQSC